MFVRVVEGAMFIISTILGVCGGILAMSSLLIAKRPNARDLIDKLVPYQGTIGLTMFVWGVFELLQVFTSLGLLASHPVLWTFWLLSGLADFGVGAILGFGLISKYLFRGNEVAIEKGQLVRQRLVAFQVPLGAAAIVTSLGYTALHFT